MILIMVSVVKLKTFNFNIKKLMSKEVIKL